MILWKYNVRSGLWDSQRDVSPETQERWLNIFRKDEPNADFVVSKRRPNGRPKKTEALTEAERCTNATVRALGAPAGNCLMYGTSVLDHLKKSGLKVTPIPFQKSLRDFIHAHPTGKYYVMSSGHAMALVNGQLTDTSGIVSPSRIKVVGAFLVESARAGLSEAVDSASKYLRDYTRLYTELHNQARAHGYIVKNLGRTVLNKEDIVPVLYLTKNQGYDTKKKKVLIAAGFHGDEQAGPWSVLEWFRNYADQADHLDVSFLPLANPAGYISGRREDGLGKDANRGWEKADNVSMKSVEGILADDLPEMMLAARDGFISLHEDNWSNEFYVKAPKISGVTEAVRTAVELNCFSTLETQIMLPDTFEMYLHERGVKHTLVSETPGKQSFRSRVDCGALVIATFLRAVGSGVELAVDDS